MRTRACVTIVQSMCVCVEMERVVSDIADLLTRYNRLHLCVHGCDIIAHASSASGARVARVARGWCEWRERCIAVLINTRQSMVVLVYVVVEL